MLPYTKQIETLKADRWVIVQKTRSILDKAEKEKRALNTEERSEMETMNTRMDDHETRIKDLEKINKDEADPENKEGDEPDAIANDGERTAPAIGETRGGRHSKPIADDKPEGETRAHATKQYRKAFSRFMTTGEYRDMTVATQSSGGYLIAPVELTKDVIKQVDNLVFIRKLAKIFKCNTAQATGVRQMTSRVGDASWTTEIGTVSADSTLAFALRELTPNLLVKLVLASYRLLESGTDIDGIVNEELAYKFGTTQENAFMNGSGSGQPLGIFVASASGIPTSQDVSGTGTATFIGDDLIAMKYAIKQPYFADPNCRWAMGRSIVQKTRTLKDSYGQYLWRAGLASDKPDTLLDVPIAISEYAPTVLTTGSYVAVLGNFRYYGIAEVKDMWIQRLVELYANTSEVGFQGRWFVDGAPLLGEAFARLKTS
jgi:HK97 family phage major capsid protein